MGGDVFLYQLIQTLLMPQFYSPNSGIGRIFYAGEVSMLHRVCLNAGNALGGGSFHVPLYLFSQQPCVIGNFYGQ